MNTKVGVLGVSSSKFGELWGVSPKKLVYETVTEAVNLSNLKISEIEAIYVGNMLSGILGNQENLGAFFAEEFNLNVPAFKIEGACASGGLAFHNGFLSVSSGIYKKVLVIGVEKMTDHSPEEVAAALMGGGTDEERASGITFPGLYGVIARSYMNKYKVTEEDLAFVPVKNHYHGSLNPKAQFRNLLTIDKVMKSPFVSSPLKLLDCSPISDGASAVVLADQNISKKKHKNPVWIYASCVATDSLGLSRRETLTSLKSAVIAARLAYKMASLRADEIDIAEVHDCFSIAEIIALEDLGFFAKGKAAEHIKKGKVTLGSDNKLVVNTSGGLKACGHPVGATGVKQVVEVADQLRGNVGDRQVEGAKVGLTHNIGGSGGVAVVNILKL